MRTVENEMYSKSVAVFDESVVLEKIDYVVAHFIGNVCLSNENCSVSSRGIRKLVARIEPAVFCLQSKCHTVAASPA